MVKAVFFDRDGVLTPLIPRPGGITTAAWTRDEFTILPRVHEALNLLSPDFHRFVITNQPDILSGDLQREDLLWWHDHLKTVLRLTDIRHAEVRGSAYYKPNAGMVLDMMVQHNVDPRQSFMVGDRWKDIDCGHRARLTTIFVGTKYDDGGSGIFPNHIVPDVYEACQLIAMRQHENSDLR